MACLAQDHGPHIWNSKMVDMNISGHARFSPKTLPEQKERPLKMCLDVGISQYCCLPHFTIKGRTCAVLPAMPSGRHAGCANTETAWLHKLLNHLSKCLPSSCTVPGSSSNLEQRIKHVHVQSPGNLVLKGHKVGRDKNR